MSVPSLILLNAFFVAAEYAVVSVRSVQIRSLRSRGLARTADAVARLKSDMPSAIGAIQVCITMTNLMLGWLGEPAVSRLLDDVLSPLGLILPRRLSVVISTTLSFIIVTLLTVVASELLPKALTLQHTLIVARLTARPMLLIMHLIRPLVRVMNTMASGISKALGLGPVRIEGDVHTAEEIMLIASEAAEVGALTARERSLILNSLALGRKTAEQIMVPRVRVAYLDLRKTMDQNFRVVDQHLFSRHPLTDGGMDHVVGVIYTKEFLTAYHAGADTSMLPLIVRPPVFVPVTLTLDRLLAVFAEERAHMLFLVDEYGGVEGIVTMRDVVDELVSDTTTP
ncbi:MAG TPA: hemolysin family protein [Tepidisphaeraceae bacterium]|nr:hemolysin family protein [Tepidisphaeraceae bacterium]